MVSTSRRFEPYRQRTLKRGAQFHVISDDDMRWLYAAYRKGAFPDAPEGMESGEFMRYVLNWYETISQIGEAWILEAPNDVSPRSEINPVGLVVARYEGHIMHPHVFWFDWATPRNRVEAALKFLTKMRFRAVVIITTRESDAKFFDHMMKYKVLRRIGTIYSYYGTENAIMYQTKGFTGETL